MKTAKDLNLPFSYEDRRPVLLDRFFYVPSRYEYSQESLPFFEKEQPVAIEYCSGNGQWIAEKAKTSPHINWIAVEKKFKRARKIWAKLQKENLSNLVVACSEAFVFTRYYAPKTAEIFINFPSPFKFFLNSNPVDMRTCFGFFCNPLPISTTIFNSNRLLFFEKWERFLAILIAARDVKKSIQKDRTPILVGKWEI